MVRNRMKRIQLSNKIRFEVFKRDLFTCQYCGKKAPDVILNIDHINPVKEGGDNNIFNLLTSCFNCNNGKSAIKLDDNSILAKQRNQIEFIEERKQQVLLLIEWKKSVSDIDRDFIEIITNYINTKVYPLTLNNGEKIITEWLKKYSINDILENIDKSAEKYLIYHSEEIFQQSAVTFMSKVGAFLNVSKMHPIQQRIRFINGIGRNRIETWNEKIALIILNKYTTRLLKYGWSENKILENLENEINPFTKITKRWSDWKTHIESCIHNIENWEEDEEFDFKELDSFFANPKQSLEEKLKMDRDEVNENILFIEYIGKAFPDFNSQKFKKNHTELIINFLEMIKIEYVEKKKNGLEENYLLNHYSFSPISDNFENDIDDELLNILNSKVMFTILENLDKFDYPQMKINKKETKKIIKIQLEYYKSLQY
jgi:HNH endonuclease